VAVSRSASDSYWPARVTPLVQAIEPGLQIMNRSPDASQVISGAITFPLSRYTLSTSFNCPASVCGPYLLPTCLDQTQPYQLALLIPNVAGSAAAPGACTIAIATNGVFALQWQAGDAGLLALVTVAPDRVFSDKPADRAALKLAFATFREALDALEQQASPQCLLPGGAAIIVNRIAAGLPLRFDELLYFYYGFDSAVRCIDLQPGMRLMIETGAYQFVAPPPATGSQGNAFVSRGQVWYDIQRNEDQMLSFNMYLNDLQAYTICPPGAPLAGIVDLNSTCATPTPSTYARRYYRLIYPNQFGNPTAIGTQPRISQNITLLGANSLAELNAATKTYVSTKTCAAAANNSVICLYFSGRTSVTPEIPVVIRGSTQYLPVGATFQDALDSVISLPPNGVIGMLQANNIVFWRYSYNALCSSSSFTQSSLSFEAQTNYVPAGAGALTQLDLPLIQGDVIQMSSPNQQQQLYQVTTQSLTDPSNPALVGPYLLPYGFTTGAQPKSLTLSIANVAGPAAKPGACGIAAGENPDFSLQWQSSNDSYVAQVSVATANLCSDDPAARAKLRDSFAAFRQSLEALEIKDQCLIAGGAALLAAQLVGSLPLRYDELLYYYYGFTPATRYVDLRPGMRLLVEAGAYQFVAPAGAPGSELNAFVSQSISAYDVVRDASQRLTFSPYIRGMQPFQITQAGAQLANRIDLAQAVAARRYYRCIYPASFPASASAQIATPPTAQNVTLLGADTLADLAAATTAYTKGQPMPSAQPPIICRYFTGRASVVPQIRVNVQGTPTYVPIGTTLRTIIDRYAVLAKDDIYAFASRVSNNVLSRYSIPSLTSAPSQDFSANPVQFTQKTPYVTVPGSKQLLTQWDLPLVLGDVITWAWNT